MDQLHWKLYNGSGVVMSDITYHYLTFVMLNKEPSFVDTEKYVLLKKRIFSEEGWRTMNNLLGSTDWSLLQDCDNINYKYDNLYLIWYSLFDRVFPIVSKRIKKLIYCKTLYYQRTERPISERRRLLKLYKWCLITYDSIYKPFNNYVYSLTNKHLL